MLVKNQPPLTIRLFSLAPVQMPLALSVTSSKVAVPTLMMTSSPDTLMFMSTYRPLLVARSTKVLSVNALAVLRLTVRYSSSASMVAVISSGQLCTSISMNRLLLSGSSNASVMSKVKLCGYSVKLIGSIWFATTGGRSSATHSTENDVCTDCPALSALRVIVAVPPVLTRRVSVNILLLKVAETRSALLFEAIVITMFSFGSSGSLKVLFKSTV